MAEHPSVTDEITHQNIIVIPLSLSHIGSVALQPVGGKGATKHGHGVYATHKSMPSNKPKA